MYTWAIYKASVWKFINVKRFFLFKAVALLLSMLVTKLHLILLNAFAKLDCKRRLLNNDEHGKSVGAIDRTAMISNASLDTIHSNKLLQSTHQFLFPTNIQFNSILVRLGVSIYLFDIFVLFSLIKSISYFIIQLLTFQRTFQIFIFMKFS